MSMMFQFKAIRSPRSPRLNLNHDHVAIILHVSCDYTSNRSHTRTRKPCTALLNRIKYARNLPTYKFRRLSFCPGPHVARRLPFRAVEREAEGRIAILQVRRCLEPDAAELKVEL